MGYLLGPQVGYIITPSWEMQWVEYFDGSPLFTLHLNHARTLKLLVILKQILSRHAPPPYGGMPAYILLS
jgi:hypothetical protein